MSKVLRTPVPPYLRTLYLVPRIILCALTVMTVSAARAQLVWFDGEHPITYQVQGKVSPVVMNTLL